MTPLGWVCLALLVAYWLWIATKKVSGSSWVYPAVISAVLCLGIYFGMESAPPPMMGGRKRWMY
jgi:hypothetical protein